MRWNEDFAAGHMIWDGTVRCAEPDAVAYYAAAPQRVLLLFTAAAEEELAVEADTLLAAVAAASGVGTLPGEAVGRAVQRILLSPAPEALGVLMAQGALAPFGLPGPAPCLHTLAALPPVEQTRWWALLRLCKADGSTVCRSLALAQELPCLLAAMDGLALRGRAPAQQTALKRVLSRLPEKLDYDAAARALALLAPGRGWETQPALFAALRLSREPYRVSMLAVTPAELTAAGIRGEKQARVLRGLLDAVIASPAVNFPEALMTLAHTLAAVG